MNILTHTSRVFALAAVALVMLLASTDRALAIVATYTSSAAYLSDLALLGLTSTTINFDAANPGDTVADGASFGGITFSGFAYNEFGGLTNAPLIVTNNFDTVSGANSIGFDDGGDRVFVNDDEFEMTLPPSSALSLYIITTPDMIDGDIALQFGSQIVSVNTANLETTLPDGGLVYFLGAINTVSPTTTAAIRSTVDTGDIYFEYNIDDITFAAVPVLAGDYNRDGTVDGADYVVWRKGVADGDYLTWQTNFGESLDLGGGANASVPEPSGLLLYAILLMSCARVRRSAI